MGGRQISRRSGAGAGSPGSGGAIPGACPGAAPRPSLSRLGEFEAKRDDAYLPISQSWRRNWPRIIPATQCLLASLDESDGKSGSFEREALRQFAQVGCQFTKPVGGVRDLNNRVGIFIRRLDNMFNALCQIRTCSALLVHGR